jgi:hypothetical protein
MPTKGDLDEVNSSLKEINQQKHHKGELENHNRFKQKLNYKY